MMLLSSVLILLAGCGGDDVPPGNTSQTVQRQIDTPQETPEPAQTNTQQQQADQPDEDLRPEEADLIPEDYTRDGGEIARLAVATLQPTAGNLTSGMVVFIQGDADDEQIRVIGKIANISPGPHGFHIHEVGNCTTPDASSAGAHYNPTGAQHADRISTVRHIGDLGNLVAAEDRTAEFDFYDEQIELQGPNSVIEKAFIVHAMEDDLTTQPAGNSGDRITCGIIKRRNAVGIPE
jgi:Cu-Zn family superoxide dismutase